MALIDDIKAYWKFDESSGDASDSTSNSNTLTNVNSTAYGTGIINNGIDFESGSSNYMTAADSTSLSITGNMSISLWIKFETVQFTALATKWTGSGNQRSFTWFYDSGELKFQVSANGSTDTIDMVSWTPSTATWYHLVVTYTAAAGEVRFYVNGSQQGTTQTGANTSIFDSTSLFRVSLYDAGDGRYTDGVQDEMGVWAKVLSGDEITSLYNGGAGFSYPFSVANTTNFFQMM